MVGVSCQDHWPRHLPRQLHFPESSLYFNLEVAAGRYPGKPAIVFYGACITFRDLHEQVDRFAAHLEQDCGVQPGDRVLLYAQNCPQFVVAYYAILRIRAVVVPVSPMSVSSELEYFLRDSGAAVAVLAQELYPALRALLRSGVLRRATLLAYSDCLPDDCDIPLPEGINAPAPAVGDAGVAHWGDVMTAPRQPAGDKPGPDDLAVIGYTSGTTGQPKGCMHSHRTVLSAVAASQAWRGNCAVDVHLAVAPMFHFLGMQGGMHGPMYTGATVVLMQRWDREAALLLMERFRVTTWAAPPAMIVDFFANPTLPGHDLSSLCFLGGGGAAMPEAVARRLQDEFGIAYNEAYGLTETAAFILGNPIHRGKRQCLGMASFAVDARIVDPDTLQELPQGQVGELILSGPQVALGYWEKPEASRETFIRLDGRRYLRTGDLCYVDEEGYYFMVDRLKRMVNVSGYKVWPAEIESIMYAHPDIHEACVVAAPDARRGETVRAVVVVKPGRESQVGEDDIIRWCREHMAAYKVPRQIRFVESLPKSATGKILWRQLQEQARAEARNPNERSG
ncbi:MAG: AMP-binding protein [Ectothiorhodospiraceae bacterium]|nr:AMP-binding protein [Ectothiorhodospiraceae bacterium]